MGEREMPPFLIDLTRRVTKSVPGSGGMWSAYLRLLEPYEGEVIKDLEAVLVCVKRAESLLCTKSILRGIRTRDVYEHSPIECG